MRGHDAHRLPGVELEGGAAPARHVLDGLDEVHAEAGSGADDDPGHHAVEVLPEGHVHQRYRGALAQFLEHARAQVDQYVDLLCDGPGSAGAEEVGHAVLQDPHVHGSAESVPQERPPARRSQKEPPGYPAVPLHAGYRPQRQRGRGQAGQQCDRLTEEHRHGQDGERHQQDDRDLQLEPVHLGNPGGRTLQGTPTRHPDQPPPERHEPTADGEYDNDLRQVGPCRTEQADKGLGREVPRAEEVDDEPEGTGPGEHEGDREQRSDQALPAACAGGHRSASADGDPDGTDTPGAPGTCAGGLVGARQPPRKPRIAMTRPRAPQTSIMRNCPRTTG